MPCVGPGCRAGDRALERGEVGGRVDVRVRAGDRDLHHELRMTGQDRAEAAVPGDLVEQPERCAAQQDRVGSAPVG